MILFNVKKVYLNTSKPFKYQIYLFNQIILNKFSNQKSFYYYLTKPKYMNRQFEKSLIIKTKLNKDMIDLLNLIKNKWNDLFSNTDLYIKVVF